MKNFFNKILEFFKRIISCINGLEENTKSRIVKIICFFCGLFFSVVGVFVVAIWKWIFSSKDEKNKYCIRLALLGFLLKILFFSHSLLFGAYYPNMHNFNKAFFGKKYDKNLNKSLENDFFEDFNDFEINDNFDEFKDNFFNNFVYVDPFKVMINTHNSIVKQHEKMMKDFQDSEEEFDKLLSNQEKVKKDTKIDNSNIENGKESDNDIKIKKEKKDGWDIVSIEQKKPNSYKKQVRATFSSKNINNNKLNKDKGEVKNKQK